MVCDLLPARWVSGSSPRNFPQRVHSESIVNQSISQSREAPHVGHLPEVQTHLWRCGKRLYWCAWCGLQVRLLPPRTWRSGHQNGRGRCLWLLRPGGRGAGRAVRCGALRHAGIQWAQTSLFQRRGQLCGGGGGETGGQQKAEERAAGWRAAQDRLPGVEQVPL